MNFKNAKPYIEKAKTIALVVIFAGAVGFYFGNSYGHGHINLASLKTAQNSSQSNLGK